MRADEHLATLDREASPFLDYARRRVRSRLNPKMMKFLTEVVEEGRLGADEAVLSLYIDALPPRQWGVIASDVLHQLRSCLDNLLCALVVLRMNTVAKSNAFPIATTPEQWDEAGRRRMWRGISACDLATLEELQPVHRSDTPDDDPLAILKRFSNHDKHEALAFTYMGFGNASSPPISADDPQLGWRVVAVRDCEVVGYGFGLGGMLVRDSTDFATVTVRVTGPDPQVGVDGDLPLRIALSGGGRTLGLDYLRVLRAETFSVIERFAPAFHD